MSQRYAIICESTGADRASVATLPLATTSGSDGSPQSCEEAGGSSEGADTVHDIDTSCSTFTLRFLLVITA